MPKAVVILNRGTDFELDLSPDVMAFSTSNTLEDLMGMFSVTIANTADRYIDRYGYCAIKKMSSVEIFVNSSNSVGGTSDRSADPGAKLNTDQQGDFVLTQEQETGNHLIDRVFGVFLHSSFVADSTRSRSQIWGYIKDKNEARIKADIDALKKRQEDIKEQEKNNLEQGQSESASSFLRIESESIDKTILQLTSTQNILNSSQPSDQPFQIGTKLMVPPVPMEMNRIFFGVITTISENTVPGNVMTISIAGKSIGYWLESSVVNVNPALAESQFLAQEVTAFATKYVTYNALQIFQELLKWSTNDILAVQNYNINNLNEGSAVLIGAGEDYLHYNNVDGSAITEKGTSVNPQLMKAAEKNSGLANESVESLNQQRADLYSGNNVPIDGVGKVTLKNWVDKNPGQTTTTGGSYTDWNNLSQEYVRLTKQSEDFNKQKIALNKIPDTDAKKKKKSSDLDKLDKNIKTNTNAIEAVRAKLDKDPVFKQTKASIDKVTSGLETAQAVAMKKGRERLLQQFGIIDMWKQVFAKVALEVVDQELLQKIYPYVWGIKSPSLYDGDYSTKAEIASNIAEKIFFEFYFDTNGHFVLKPPMYNVGVETDSSAYILEDNDITSISMNDTVDGILTSVTVVGKFYEAPMLQSELLKNTYQDFNLIKQYGIHGTSLSDLTFIRNIEDAKGFGQAYMTKNNQRLLNAQVTIPGRSQMRLGLSTYVKPRDIVFYIVGIQHQLDAGGQYTTTLNLEGGRRIVYGLRVNSEIQRFVKSTNYNTSQRQLYTVSQLLDSENSNTDKNLFTHYLLATNSNINIDDLIKQINEEASRSQDDNSASGIVANKDDTKFSSYFVIVKNGFIIVSHPDPALIGLVVDPTSPIISATNLANFSSIREVGYITSSDKDISTTNPYIKNTFQELKKRTSAPANIKDAFTFIDKVFRYFSTQPGVALGSGFLAGVSTGDGLGFGDLPTESITSAEASYDGFNPYSISTNPQGHAARVNISKLFTLEVMNSFNTYIFGLLYNIAKKENVPNNNISQVLSKIKASTQSDGSNQNLLQLMQQNPYVSDMVFQIINDLINAMSDNGSYRVYTDENGREYPALLNYGLSAVEDYAARAIGENTNAIEEAANKKALQEKRNDAQKLSGLGLPKVSTTKAAVPVAQKLSQSNSNQAALANKGAVDAKNAANNGSTNISPTPVPSNTLLRNP